jgi:hypothetical protein
MTACCMDLIKLSVPIKVLKNGAEGLRREVQFGTDDTF